MKFSDLILYKDKDVFVINKPAGLVVHGDGKIKEKTLADLILAEYPKMKDVGEPFQSVNKEEDQKIYRPGIVHRLDRETSGVLIIARTQESFSFLKSQFQDRKIKKNYKAFVWGLIKKDDGVIDKPIGRSKSDFRMWSAQRGARGEQREAITEYKVLNRFEDESIEDGVAENKFTFVDIFPQTGRTHQIRVHFKYLNHPLVGDSLYSGKRGDALGFKRLALHAHKVEFTTEKGELLKIEAPLPPDFKKVIKKFNL